MKLTDVLLKEYIVTQLPGVTKEDSIRNMVDVLAKHKIITNREKIVQSVMEREEIMTTGVGNGIAIPHCKDDSIQNFAVCLGVTENRIDFDSIDNNPVHIIFLLVGPESQPGLHIKFLSRISRLMNNEEIRNEVLAAKSHEQIHTILLNEENKFFDLK